MSTEYEQLRGRVESVTFQNTENGFAVITLSGPDGEDLCAVGPLAHVAPGEQVVLAGRFIQHASYGRQFEAVSSAAQLPQEEDSILLYLSSGVLPGIGPATARRIVQRFGVDSLEVLATRPEELASIQGFSLQKAKLASRKFQELYGAREALVRFAALGLTASEALRLYRHMADAAVDQIAENPYLLCAAPLFLPFARVDGIAARLAFEADSDQRVAAALLYTLRHNLNEGHTCLPRPRLQDRVVDFFHLERGRVEDQLELLQEQGQIKELRCEGECYVYLADAYVAEATAALRITGLLQAPARNAQGIDRQVRMLEKAAGIRYAQAQKDAIAHALTRRALVITGGPGTGKTTTLNAIITLYEQQAERVLLCAPTGRAAKRLAELTGRKAATIHRLLEARFAEEGAGGFARNEKNPLKCDVLVADEMSMVDAYLFEALLAALPAGCRLVLVGDADQLPSVGAGNVLRGIISSGVVPVVALTEIFRQAAKSLIVQNAHRILAGQAPQLGGKQDDYFFLKAYGSDCQRQIVDLVARRLPAGYGYAPGADIQVLCPGRKGLLGTEQLNECLQKELNPPAPEKVEIRRGGLTLRRGDKVMQNRNNYDIPYTTTGGEPGTGAYNGDIGVVEEVDPRRGTLTVLCEDHHVFYTAEQIGELELAWAVTIHKSQGNEFPAVVIPVAEVPRPLRYRNLLYTAVTRARRLCVVVGEPETIQQMVNNGCRTERYSCFAAMLRQAAQRAEKKTGGEAGNALE